MDFDPIKINTYKIDKSKFVAVFKINKSTNEKINSKELESFLISNNMEVTPELCEQILKNDTINNK